MNKNEETKLLEQIDDLVDAMCEPTSENQIKNERLKVIAAMLAAIVMTENYEEYGDDDTNENFHENMQECVEALNILRGFQQINLEVADSKVN